MVVLFLLYKREFGKKLIHFVVLMWSLETWTVTLIKVLRYLCPDGLSDVYIHLCRFNLEHFTR